MKRYLIDVDTGRVAHAKLVKGRFGPAWALLEEDGRYKQVFVTDSPGALKRAGYQAVSDPDSATIEPDTEVDVAMSRKSAIEVADVLETYLKGGWVREAEAKERLSTALAAMRKATEETP